MRPADIEGCNDLHNRIYQENRTLAQFRWEFVENTYGQSAYPFAFARDGRNIVGTQAFIPIQMIDRDGVFWTAKSEATLVDPAFRGQQLFEKMYDLLFKYADEHQFASIWGFTPAIKAFTKLGFDVPTVTEQIFLPFSSRSIGPMLEKAKGASSSSLKDHLKKLILRGGAATAGAVSAGKLLMTSKSLPEGVSIRVMEQPDQQAGDCCRRFVAQWGGTTIYRDAAYLRWRLYDNPYVRSVVKGMYDGTTLLGWVAYTLGDDGLGYLVDIILACDTDRHDPARLVRLLLIEAILGTRDMGASGIRGWHVNAHPFDKLLLRESRKVGFYHVKRGHYVVLRTCKAGEGRASLNNFDDWYVSRIFTEGVLS